MSRVEVKHADCLDALREVPDGSVDAVITDPPYGLGILGNEWDDTIPGAAVWAEVRRTLRPGGYLLAMGGTRTSHRLATEVEAGGLEVRDCLLWLYGTGFPKGAGCLKPAWEPILLARRPGPTVLPLGIDAGRVGDRYPANVAHDGSPEVEGAFAAFGVRRGGARPARRSGMGYGGGASGTAGPRVEMDGGTVGRLFYCAKPSKAERGEGNAHPTVKPAALFCWLVRLASPPGGLILDPFAGSGTTGLAALREGRRALLIERHGPYVEVIRARLAAEGAGQ